MSNSYFHPASENLNNVIDHLLDSPDHFVRFEAEDNKHPESNSYGYTITSIEFLIQIIKEIEQGLYFNIEFTITK